MTNQIDRHDIPSSFLVFLNEARQRQVADLGDLWVLAVQHGGNYRAVVDEILGWAFANRHSIAGSERHAELVKLAEKFWTAVPVQAVAS